MYKTLLQSAIIFEKFAEAEIESSFAFLKHYIDEYQRIIPEKTKLAIQSFSPPSLQAFVDSFDPKEKWNHKTNKTKRLFQDIFLAINLLSNSFNSFWRKGKYEGREVVLIDTLFDLEIPTIQTHPPLAFSITDEEFDSEMLMDLEPKEQNEKLEGIYEEKILQVQGIFKTLEWAASKVSSYKFNTNSADEYAISFLNMLSEFLMDVSSGMKSHTADFSWAAEIEQDAEKIFLAARKLEQSKPEEEEFFEDDFDEYDLEEMGTKFLP